jgi:hypothetical protein
LTTKTVARRAGVSVEAGRLLLWFLSMRDLVEEPIEDSWRLTPLGQRAAHLLDFLAERSDRKAA